MKNLILHIPHASTYIPNHEGFIGDENKILSEVLKLTDWYTDDLFSFEKAISVKAPFSRLFCDVERFENDLEEPMAKYGMGVLYERFDSGEILRQVTSALRKQILEGYYWPHHQNLKSAVKNQLNANSLSTILDCHSFPNIPFNYSEDKNPNRPDFNIGTDLFHTPKSLVDFTFQYFTSKGYSVEIDWPYNGTIVPLEYYQTNRKVQSIMLEVNRKLYLEEPTNKKAAQYYEIKKVIQGYIDSLFEHIQ